ncbi:MAG: cytidine deaminase [candidate division KSB1 bacterium]|nr:cytidine deaminase [candidate division KSB1 bacterium]
MDTHRLIELAIQARKPELAPYSGFSVGAALLTQTGHVYTGCNIESSSYGLTICAERVALFKALSEGETKFSAIAIVAPGSNGAPPCGACRQLLNDYAPNLFVHIASLNGEVNTETIKDLLPLAFDGGFLSDE